MTVTTHTVPDHAFGEIVEQLTEDGLPPVFDSPRRHRGRWLIEPWVPMRDVAALLAWAGHLDGGPAAAIVTAYPCHPGTLLEVTGRLSGRLVVLRGSTHRPVTADPFGLVDVRQLAQLAADERAGRPAARRSPGPPFDLPAQLAAAAATVARARVTLERAGDHLARARSYLGPPAPASLLTIGGVRPAYYVARAQVGPPPTEQVPLVRPSPRPRPDAT